MTRIHIVSLPHTLLTREYDYCAYTAKVRRFIGMLGTVGVDTLVYGPDVRDNDVTPTEYVTIVDEADRVAWFGAPEWDTDQVFDRWNTDDECWAVTNTRAAQEIRARWEPGDILGLIGGLCQQQIMTDLADLQPLTCEWGIGYSGVVPGTHRVFESYAWMHHIAGYYREDDLRFFDTVIPNCFNPEDFLFSEEPGEYLLYMGRPNARKGLAIIEEIAKRSDIPVLIAGQPGPTIPGTEYVGLVLGEKKQLLLSGARALLTPTTYLEPFGGVAIESMFSGTPVIATDYGAFTETVVEGLSGYRCRMLVDFLIAVERAGDLDRNLVRQHAMTHYSTDVGSELYGDYLDRLTTLSADGWYADADAIVST